MQQYRQTEFCRHPINAVHGLVVGSWGVVLGEGGKIVVTC